MKPGNPGARIFPAAVTLAGAALTLAALSVRAVHYSGLALPSALDGALGALLALSFSLILVQLIELLPLSAALTALVLALWRLWPKALFRRTDEGWQTRLGFHALIWLQIFFTSFVLDLDPRLAWSFGAGVAVHLALASPRGRRLWGGRASALWLAWLGVFVVVALVTGGWVDRLSVGVWCALQPWLTGVLVRAADWRDRLWPAALSVMLGQLIGSWMPYLISDPAPAFFVAIFFLLRFGFYRLLGRPRLVVRSVLGLAALVGSLAAGWNLGQRVHLEGRGAGGTLLGTDLAYNFCESPERRRLAVTVPICSGPGGPNCRRGRVDVYDLDTLEQTDSLRPFDERFSGRMEQILCQDERLLVGMCCASPDDRRDRLVVTALSWSGKVLEQTLLPEFETNRVQADPEGGALWLAGRELVRLDVETGERKLVAMRRPPGIFVFERGAMSERRGSVFVGEFVNASSVREFDRTTLLPKREIATGNGSVVAATVDDGKGRLWVTGLWGVDVFDYTTGRRVASQRLGFASRTPFIDARRGLVYIPSTTSGKIYVLDREDARLLGAIAIGFGARNVFLANGGRWFLASSEHGLWYWDATELAARFKAAPPERASAR